MEVKRDILWRVYLSFLGIVVLGLVILGKAIYIQRVEGNKWIAMAQKQQQRIIDIDADRGTIYSEDGSMLSTSIPFFDIYIDFAADGLQEKKRKAIPGEHRFIITWIIQAVQRSRYAGIQAKTAAGFSQERPVLLIEKKYQFSTI